MAMFLNSTADINYYVGYVNTLNTKYGEKGIINPTTFYSKQLLDTIRIDSANYCYYRLADEMPIGEKADRLQVRRWAPLQAHTIPLEEGIPPTSDKGSVEKYEIEAFQYGRFMEFTDKVDFAVVDPVVAHYSKEYSIVAIETLDLLARDALFSVADRYYAKYGAANYTAGTLNADNILASTSASYLAKRPASTEFMRAGCIPNMADLRVIVLKMKKSLIKPRSNGKFHVIASPEFFFDMISDPLVEKYMTINQTTKTMYDNTQLVPMFELEFYETMCTPTSAEFYKSGALSILIYSETAGGYRVLSSASKIVGFNLTGATPQSIGTAKSGYMADSRTGQSASYIPAYIDWDGAVAALNAEGTTALALETPALSAAATGFVNATLDGVSAYNATTNKMGDDWVPVKVQHTLIVGKDALVRTGLQGEGQAKMYVKQKGSAGVLDPIDQRQSIGFKINSVGFGSTRLEAIVDYISIPTQIGITPTIKMFSTGAGTQTGTEVEDYSGYTNTVTGG